MPNKVVTNRGLWAFISVCFLTVLAMPRLAACSEEQDEDYRRALVEHYYNQQIVALQLRANVQVDDVNQDGLAQRQRAEAVRRNRCLEELGYVPSENLLSKTQLAELEAQRAQREAAIRTKIQLAVESLQAQKAIALETQPYYATQRPTVWTSRRPLGPPKGKVTGIVFQGGTGAALISDEIVRENDTLFGVRVLKINADHVEFEKKGRTWTQYVGEAPPAFWGK